MERGVTDLGTAFTCIQVRHNIRMKAFPYEAAPNITVYLDRVKCSHLEYNAFCDSDATHHY